MKTGAKLLLVLVSLVAILGVRADGASAASSVSINEFVSHPISGESDWVELYNGSAAAVSLNGWYLRDTAVSNLKTFTATDEIPAGGWLVVSVSSRLGNTGDTIELYSPTGLEDTIVYPASVPAPTQGQSAGRSADGSGVFVVFATPTKGTSNNPVVAPDPEYGEVRVHAVKEINDNQFADFANGEPHQAGIAVRIYDASWALVDSGVTTGQYYNKSLRFTLQTGSYYICQPVVAGYNQTFGRTITGWLTAPDTSVSNLSAASDEYGKCVGVQVAKNAITSHVFGLREPAAVL